MNTRPKGSRLDTMTAEELTEAILRLVERSMGQRIFFRRLVASKQGGELIPVHRRIAEMLDAWRDS